MSALDHSFLKASLRGAFAFGLLIPLEVAALAEAGLHDQMWLFCLLFPLVLLADALALFWVITGETPRRQK